MLNRLDGWETQLTALPKLVGGGEDGDPAKTKKYDAVLKAARDLNKKVKELKDKVYNRDVQRDTPSDTLHYHSDFQGRPRVWAFGGRSLRRGAAASGARRRVAADPQGGGGLPRAVQRAPRPMCRRTTRRPSTQGVPTLFVGDPIAILPPAGF